MIGSPPVHLYRSPLVSELSRNLSDTHEQVKKIRYDPFAVTQRKNCTVHMVYVGSACIVWSFYIIPVHTHTYIVCAHAYTVHVHDIVVYLKHLGTACGRPCSNILLIKLHACYSSNLPIKTLVAMAMTNKNSYIHARCMPIEWNLSV